MAVNRITSPAVRFAAPPVVLENASKVAEVAFDADCCKYTLDAWVMSLPITTQPLGAAGKVSVPELDVALLPTTTLKEAVEVAVIVAFPPNPDAIVGAVDDMMSLPLMLDEFVTFKFVNDPAAGVVPPIVELLIVTFDKESPAKGGKKATPPGPIRPRQLPLASNCP